jgi:hypothetical protein
MKPKQKDEGPIQIVRISKTALRIALIGRAPLIFNCMSEKAKRELVGPHGRKTDADKAANIKHDPLAEFRASVYRAEDLPTALVFPSSAIKSAMMNAAVDLPGGVSKAAVGRLIRVLGYSIPIYGIPKLFCAVVRTKGINQTPDVRTRAILPEWACEVEIQISGGRFNANSITNLIAAAGDTIGIGDWRQEKGKGYFGLFEPTSPDDPDWLRIRKSGGREAQLEALAAPAFFDEESRQLVEWYEADVRRKGIKSA